MPDWPNEIRDAVARLNLEPTREASLVEELAQHLSDRYDEMIGSGVTDAQTGQLLKEELNDGTLIAELRPILPSSRPPVSPGIDEQGDSSWE